MDFETIETAYHLLLDNVQALQSHLKTTSYEALIEQNVAYVTGVSDLSEVEVRNNSLKELHLSSNDWRRTFQFLLMKLAQTEKLQANHQFTPDSIGLLMTLVMDSLAPSPRLSVLEVGSGMGMLAQTILTSSQKTIDYFGIELDDLLIDLSASMADVSGLEMGLAQGDAVRPQLMQESQIIVGDLPIGYYPDDIIASRYQVYCDNEHTYAHHLLIEQSLKYLAPGGHAFFLAPSNLLTSPQSDLFKQWLVDKAGLSMVISLPPSLFGDSSLSKSLFGFCHKEDAPEDIFAYPLQDLQDAKSVANFLAAIASWQGDK